MLVNIKCIVCDYHSGDCGKEIQGIGPDATVAKLSEQARQEGWAVSSAGHFCPEHRRRKA